MDAEVIYARTRRLGVDVWLVTLTDATATVTWRFTNYREDIVYDGQTYTAWDMQISSPAADEIDAAPAADIRLCNVDLSKQVQRHNYDFFRGGTATILLYNTSCPSADYSDDIDVLEIVNDSSDRLRLVFHLGLPQVYQDETPQAEFGPKCCFELADGFCGYSGAETTCAHNLTACRSLGNEDAYGGEMGLRGGGWRIGV